MKLKSILLVGAAIASASAMARTEPNSFLNKPANSKAALSKAVRTDRVLLSRVMRHWGLTKDQAFSWVDSLQPSKLSATGIWLVYNCQANEAIQARLRTLQKGRAIWVDSKGQPVALVSCFNPIRKGTDEGDIEPTAEIFVEPAGERAVTPNPEPEALFQPAPPVGNELQASAQNFSAIAPGAMGQVPVAGGGFAFPWWIAGAGLLIPQGGDGGGPNPPNPPTGPPAVPEPGLMIAFGGAAAVAALRKKKKSS